MTIHYDPKPDSASPYSRVNKRYAQTVLRDTTAPSPGLYRAAFKRVLDIALVCLAAPIIVLTVALLALGAARDGGNPFYCQDRVGRDGQCSQPI